MRLTRTVGSMLILILAGCTGGSPRPTPTGSGETSGWETLADVPTARTEVAAAAIQGKIYVIGGFLGGGESSDLVEIYDIASDSWSEGPKLPIEVNHAMATAGESLYVLGGCRQGLAHPSDRAFRLDGSRWTELPRMPEPRGAAGAAVIDGVVYVAGGVGPGGLATTVMRFDIQGSRWSLIEGPPTPREHLSVAGGDGRLFVLGGRTGGIGSNLTTAEAFDAASGQWGTLPDMPTARGGSAGAFWHGGLAISAGGEAEATFSEVEAYDIAGAIWKQLPSLPTARHGLGAVVVGDVLYALAGGTIPGLSVSDANEALDLSSL